VPHARQFTTLWSLEGLPQGVLASSALLVTAAAMVATVGQTAETCQSGTGRPPPPGLGGGVAKPAGEGEDFFFFGRAPLTGTAPQRAGRDAG